MTIRLAELKAQTIPASATNPATSPALLLSHFDLLRRLGRSHMSTRTIFLNYLRSIQATPAAKAFLKRTCQEFVLEHGWWYEPCNRPPAG
jgi:hypothetical protein